ncbi:MAG: phage terminase large subunit family protein [Bryobacteraceae bacterium]
MAAKVTEQLTPMFAGEIWESDADVPMGKGYANDGQPFDIETACYLKPVFRAIRSVKVRLLVMMAGIQTLKSFASEKSAIYFARHDPGDMVFYDCDEDAATDHMRSRMGPLLYSIPSLAAQFAEVVAGDRHEITTTEFYLPGMTLRFWPLNDSSASRITLRYVIVSDAYLTKKSGLIEMALGRMTQRPLDCKGIVESRGGEPGDDVTRIFGETDMGMLWVSCPFCGKAQEFVWEARRPDGSFAGMKRSPAELIAAAPSELNEARILRETHYECVHCRGVWQDTTAMRAALDRSSHYVAANPKADPSKAGFSWPQWAGRRLPWGNIMLKYLATRKHYDDTGDMEPHLLWWREIAGRSVDDKMFRVSAPILIGTAKFDGTVPNEVFRSGQVDCQKDVKLSQQLGREVTGHFWAVADAVDKFGNTFELWRGYCTSWDEWIKKFAELKIPTRNIAIDGAHWTDAVKEQAARHRTMEDGKDRHGRPCKVWATWKVMRGADAKGFRWDDGQWRAYRITNEPVNLLDEKTGNWTTVLVPVVEWSNFTVKNQLDSSLIGQPGKPKMTQCSPDVLSATTRAKEAEKDFSYDSQLYSEKLGEYRGKPKWLPIHKQNHYRDCKCEGIVLKMMKGLVGAIAPPDESAQRVGE